MHPLDDDLVLHYYGELDGPDEVRLSTHLSECGECQLRYRGLQQVLLSVNEASVAAYALPDGFERTVWARLVPVSSICSINSSASWSRWRPAPTGCRRGR